MVFDIVINFRHYILTLLYSLASHKNAARLWGLEYYFIYKALLSVKTDNVYLLISESMCKIKLFRDGDFDRLSTKSSNLVKYKKSEKINCRNIFSI
uniref:Uncharacterized protein n=1 Tax=uncultured Desulfobacterium sp. TaxID=201089 RepID=E1Y9Q3_9BACT|nr:unknown protein [uncultured Desulfobacterium sp.]